MKRAKQQRFDEKFLDKLWEIKHKKEQMVRKDLSWSDFSKLIAQTPGAFDELERKILESDKNIMRSIGIKFDGGLR